MDHISTFADSHFARYGRNLNMCKKLKKRVQKSTFMKYDHKLIQGNSFQRIKRLRELEYVAAMPQGWMSSDPDEVLNTVKGAFQIQENLEKLRLSFCGNPMSEETIESLCEALPKLIYLHNFSLEFLNSKISENEVITFAQMLPQLKSLERLRFKVIQYPSVSEGCIYYLMSIISKMPNLKFFEVYFRRLTIPEEVVQELLNRFAKFENIQCCYSRQCLAFSRNSIN